MVHCALEEKNVSGVEDSSPDAKENAKTVAFVQGTQIDSCDEEQSKYSH